jgi:hypothetical protein
MRQTDPLEPIRNHSPTRTPEALAQCSAVRSLRDGRRARQHREPTAFEPQGKARHGHGLPMRRTCRQYHFDAVWDETADDDTVFASGVEPLVASVRRGQSATLIM